MVIAELVSLLGFKVDRAGAQQFDSIMDGLRNKAEASAVKMQSVFQGAAITIGAAFAGLALVGRPIAEAGDAMNTSIAKIESSIGRSATSGEEAAAIYEQLYEVGTRTGVSADQSAASFTRFNLAMQDLNRPASDTVKLIEGIQAAGIIAGTSTTELTNSVTQLGQALGSGKLQGDELKTLRESMPRFLRDVQREMHMTGEEFFKAAEKGLLTPAQIVPAMLAASETARRELANFPMSMARSFSILGNSARRFLAELDKQLGLSKLVAAVFISISRTLDSWRSGLSVIGSIVSALGGLENIARLLGIALLIAIGPTVFGMAMGLARVFVALGATIYGALLPLIALAAWALIIEDFIAWIQGRESLFGERFGDFETSVAAPMREQVTRFRTWFEDQLTSLRDSIVANFQGMMPQFEWLGNALRFIGNLIFDAFTAIRNALGENTIALIPFVRVFVEGARLIQEAFGPLDGFFDRLLGAIQARFEGLINFFRGWIDRVRSILPDWLTGSGGGEGAAPAAGGGQDDVQRERSSRFGSRGRIAGGFPDIFDPDTLRGLGMRLPDGAGAVARQAGGPLSGAPVVINPQQDNVITNQIVINAPGADPASIAGAGQNGVTRAMDGAISRLGGSLALGLGIGSPRVEIPTQ